MPKEETRIIPEGTAPKFYAQHLKPYEFIGPKVSGKRVLEAGCGDGYGSAYLAQSAASSVVGIDYEEAVIKDAKRKYQARNLEFVTMDALKLEFPGNSFDAACSFQVIEHIREGKLFEFLREIKRVLKEGGEFYLSTLNLEHNLKRGHTYKRHPAHVREFRLSALKELLSLVWRKSEIYGLHLTPKHRFYQRLKKSGIFNPFPFKINPVANFYKNITTSDFTIISDNLSRASDFICVCRDG